MKYKYIYSGTAILLNNNYEKLFNKNISNINKEINKLIYIFKHLLKKIKSLKKKLNYFKIKYYKNLIDTIIYILNNDNLLYESINMIKKKYFNYLKSIILILNYKINNNNNINYINSIKYIGNYLINYKLNNYILNININNNCKNIIVIIKDLSIFYIIKFIFINIKCIIINYFNNKKFYFCKNLYKNLKIYSINNVFKLINNGDYLVIDSINNKIFINPSLYTINKIYK